MSDASSEGTGPGSRAGGDRFTQFIDDVDFPGFVADLIKGLYGAIVDASVQQMDAYSGLVKRVADSVGDFMDDVARTGSECLDGLCPARAWANTTADAAEPREDAAPATQPDPKRES